MELQKKIAKQILETYGYDFTTAIQGGGWTNAVWINDYVAIRVAGEMHNNRIHKEVSLSKLLPAKIGYPKVLAIGITEGFAWSLSKRIHAVPLSSVWSALSLTEKKTAIMQVLSMVETIHHVNMDKAKSLVVKRTWYSSLRPAEADLQLQDYETRNLFTHAQMLCLQRILEQFWLGLAQQHRVLCHGDVTTDNLLWDGTNVVTLMDFEHAALLPAEADIHNLLQIILLDEQDDGSPAYTDYRDSVLCAVMELLPKTKGSAVLTGFALLYRMRFLALWLAEPEGTLNDLWAYRDIIRLAARAQYPKDFIQ